MARELVIAMNTEELERVIAAMRVCLSQMGFALDNLLVQLKEIRDDREEK